MFFNHFLFLIFSLSHLSRVLCSNFCANMCVDSSVWFSTFLLFSRHVSQLRASPCWLSGQWLPLVTVYQSTQAERIPLHVCWQLSFNNAAQKCWKANRKSNPIPANQSYQNISLWMKRMFNLCEYFFHLNIGTSKNGTKLIRFLHYYFPTVNYPAFKKAHFNLSFIIHQ